MRSLAPAFLPSTTMRDLRSEIVESDARDLRRAQRGWRFPCAALRRAQASNWQYWRTQSAERNPPRRAEPAAAFLHRLRFPPAGGPGSRYYRHRFADAPAQFAARLNPSGLAPASGSRT